MPLILALLLVAIGSLPYGYGYASAGSDETFMDFIGRGTPGANSYLAFARQVAEGHNRVTNLYTPDAPSNAYFNAEWWFMGAAARATGLSLVALFHIGRALSVVAFALAAYYLCAVYLPTAAARRAGLALICLGAGFGWVVLAANAALGLHFSVPLDAKGVTLFGYCMNKPHFIRAAFFAAMQYAWLIRGDQTGRIRYFAASGLAAAGHSLIRPYQIPEACLVLALYLAARVLYGRTAFRPAAVRVVVAGLCHAPAIAWHAWIFLENPLGLRGMNAWDPIFLLPQVLWLGLPFVAILLHLAFNVLRGTAWKPDHSIPVLWLAAALLLLHAHPYFRFGVESYFPWVFAPPLLFLRHTGPALAAGLERWGIAPARHRIAAMAVAALAVFPTNAYVYATFFTELHDPLEPWRYYITHGTLDGIAWLREHAPDAPVVLASNATSPFIPRLADLRVATGQDVLTAHYPQMAGHVGRFYQTPGDDAFKQWFCREYHVAYVFLGPEERAPNAMNPADHPWLERVYAAGDVEVYRVVL